MTMIMMMNENMLQKIYVCLHHNMTMKLQVVDGCVIL